MAAAFISHLTVTALVKRSLKRKSELQTWHVFISLILSCVVRRLFWVWACGYRKSGVGLFIKKSNSFRTESDRVLVRASDSFPFFGALAGLVRDSVQLKAQCKRRNISMGQKHARKKEMFSSF